MAEKCMDVKQIKFRKIKFQIPHNLPSIDNRGKDYGPPKNAHERRL